MTPLKLPKQPPIWLSYYRAGRLLHGALGLFILESLVYFEMLSRVWGGDNLFWIGFWIWSFMFSFVHIFLVIMDSWSRFQDYKKAKDLFFMYGMHPRLRRTIHRFEMPAQCRVAGGTRARARRGFEVPLQPTGRKMVPLHPLFHGKRPLFHDSKGFLATDVPGKILSLQI